MTKPVPDTNLDLVIVDRTNWRCLYRDPNTGQLWETTWPNSELHGGGAPLIARISVEDAVRKFGPLPT